MPKHKTALVKLKKRSQFRWINPMLSVLVDAVPTDGGWLFEKKFDGERCLVFRDHDTVKLYSRNKLPLNTSYPELVTAFQNQPCQSFTVDGEIVAGMGKLGSFEKLQNRMNASGRSSRSALRIYLFDILFYNGYDVRALPLIERKLLLKKALQYDTRIRYSNHVLGSGRRYFELSQRQGWEGIMAKRSESTYVSKRSRDWLKCKVVHGQELVIGGYTAPAGSRVGFGALLVGYYERGKLKFAGKVGTGYNRELLKALSAQLRELQQEKNPFVGEPRVIGAQWVKPVLVAEIGFTEWTRDGKLRHPRFEGLRFDKRARDVIRERPRALTITRGHG